MFVCELFALGSLAATLLLAVGTADWRPTGVRPWGAKAVLQQAGEMSGQG